MGRRLTPAAVRVAPNAAFDGGSHKPVAYSAPFAPPPPSQRSRGRQPATRRTTGSATGDSRNGDTSGAERGGGSKSLERTKDNAGPVATRSGGGQAAPAPSDIRRAGERSAPVAAPTAQRPANPQRSATPQRPANPQRSVTTPLAPPTPGDAFATADGHLQRGDGGPPTATDRLVPSPAVRNLFPAFSSPRSAEAALAAHPAQVARASHPSAGGVFAAMRPSARSAPQDRPTTSGGNVINLRGAEWSPPAPPAGAGPSVTATAEPNPPNGSGRPPGAGEAVIDLRGDAGPSGPMEDRAAAGRVGSTVGTRAAPIAIGSGPERVTPRSPGSLNSRTARAMPDGMARGRGTAPAPDGGAARTALSRVHRSLVRPPGSAWMALTIVGRNVVAAAQRRRSIPGAVVPSPMKGGAAEISLLAAPLAVATPESLRLAAPVKGGGRRSPHVPEGRQHHLGTLPASAAATVARGQSPMAVLRALLTPTANSSGVMNRQRRSPSLPAAHRMVGNGQVAPSAATVRAHHLDPAADPPDRTGRTNIATELSSADVSRLLARIEPATAGKSGGTGADVLPPGAAPAARRTPGTTVSAEGTNGPAAYATVTAAGPHDARSRRAASPVSAVGSGHAPDPTPTAPAGTAVSGRVRTPHLRRVTSTVSESASDMSGPLLSRGLTVGSLLPAIPSTIPAAVPLSMFRSAGPGRAPGYPARPSTAETPFAATAPLPRALRPSIILSHPAQPGPVTAGHPARRHRSMIRGSFLNPTRAASERHGHPASPSARSDQTLPSGAASRPIRPSRAIAAPGIAASGIAASGIGAAGLGVFPFVKHDPSVRTRPRGTLGPTASRQAVSGDAAAFDAGPGPAVEHRVQTPRPSSGASRLRRFDAEQAHHPTVPNTDTALHSGPSGPVAPPGQQQSNMLGRSAVGRNVHGRDVLGRDVLARCSGRDALGEMLWGEMLWRCRPPAPGPSRVVWVGGMRPVPSGPPAAPLGPSVHSPGRSCPERC